MGERDGQLAAVSENFESSLDAVAETLFEPAEDTPASKSEAPKRVAEGEDFVDENDVDNSVDPDDVDLLEGYDEEDNTNEPGDDDIDDEPVDPDEIEYDVTVDGQVTKAKLKELKAAFSGNKAIDSRIQQAGEFRKQQEVLTTELMKQLNVQVEKLKQLDSVLAQAENNNIDWDTLRATDPQRYLIEKDKQQELNNKRRILAQAEEDTRKQQQMLMLRKQAEYAAEQAEILMQKLPDLRNTEKAKKIGESWNKTAREYGYTDEEVANIIDHRHLLVLTDAMKYRALVAAKQARHGKNGNGQRQQPKPLLRPGSQNYAAKASAIKAERAAMARAAKTGAIDDVAATLLVSAPRKNAKRTGF